MDEEGNEYRALRQRAQNDSVSSKNIKIFQAFYDEQIKEKKDGEKEDSNEDDDENADNNYDNNYGNNYGFPGSKDDKEKDAVKKEIIKIPREEYEYIIEILYQFLYGRNPNPTPEELKEFKKRDEKHVKYSWDAACEMLKKPKKYIDDCYYMDKIDQWKIDLVRDKIANFELDE